MDDIFYMTDKKINISDIAEIAGDLNVRSAFIPESSDVLQIEYSYDIMAEWFRMEPEDFPESEDKKFLTENKIHSVFCISSHLSNFAFMFPHIKMLLQKYGGWIGSDSKGFQPCFSQENIDFLTSCF